MKRIKKRLLALLMSFVMTLGIVISPGGMTAAALDATVNLSSLTADYTISESGSYIFSGALTDGYHIVVNQNISGDVNITLSSVKIGYNMEQTKYKYMSALEIGSGTTVNLTVTGLNFMIGGNAPGILVPAGATLNIGGDGYLNASCIAVDKSAAGIGGARGGTCGTITINSGALIKAIGYKGSAGIGSGYQGSGGSIIINGGTVTASAGEYGGGAAIGSGIAAGSCSVTIRGGNIRAASANYGAAIGNGYGSIGAAVTITGGSVIAVSEGTGSAIGNGQGDKTNQPTSTVLISGGTVTATGSATSAGIGGGALGNGCDLTITGGTVTASGYTGIGIGENGSSSGSCVVTGGSVKITSIISAAQAAVYYDATGTRAYPVSFAIPGITAATAVSYTVSAGSTVSCTTDTDGRLYLWLPAQVSAAVSVAVSGGQTYVFSGAVTSSGTNTLAVQASSEKTITAFSIDGLTPVVSGTIDENGKTIALTVPYGTDVTALVPTITHTGAVISPDTGVAQDFSAPASYTVTAEDGTTHTYTVTVTVAADTRSSAKAITGFTLGGIAGTINEAGHTIAVTVPYGTNVTNLTPIITASDKAGVSPASGSAKDFTNPVAYTVTAENGTTQNYTVTVTVAADTRSSAKAITGFTLGGFAGTVNEAGHTIAVTVPYGTNVTNLTPAITVSDKAGVSPASGSAKDFTNRVTYTVTAENGTTHNYTVTVTVAADTRSSAKAITGFTLGGFAGTVNEAGHTIAVTVPYGTNVTNLTPAITVSDKAGVSPASGSAKDFTNPVTYTVTAENGTTQNYTVTVTVAADTRSSAKAITGFTLGGFAGTINEAGHTIAVTVPYGTNVTNLPPTITVSDKASVSPTSGAAKDFTQPVAYTVTAENGTTQSYTVTVTVASSSTSVDVAITGAAMTTSAGSITITAQIPATSTGTSTLNHIVVNLGTVSISAPSPVMRAALGGDTTGSLSLSHALSPAATQALVAAAAASNNLTPIGTLDLNLMHLIPSGASTAVHQLSGNIAVTVQLTGAQIAQITNAANARILYFDPVTASFTDMGATFNLAGGTATFFTSHLSTYVIAQTTTTTSPGTTQNPKTGDSNLPMIPLALLGMGSISGLIIKKKCAKWKVKKQF